MSCQMHLVQFFINNKYNIITNFFFFKWPYCVKLIKTKVSNAIKIASQENSFKKVIFVNSTISIHTDNSM